MARHELSGIPTADNAPDTIRVPARDLLPTGSLLGGRYELRGRLGSGGMGAVYRAYDRELQEEIALKVVLPERLEDPEAIDRLRREVKLARQITHPYVCRVFDLGESEGLYFLTMELIEGRTLRARLREGAPPSEEALELLSQIAEGLMAAHAQGIIHRDLKPENILLRSDGRPVIADFGLARKPRLEAGAENGQEGTPAYMSPEQIQGEPLDVRSDVFALGVVGFELMTGQRPFGEGPLEEMRQAILREAPRPFDIPGWPEPVVEAMREVFRRALAKRKEERFDSAKAFGDALLGVRSSGEANTTLEGVANGLLSSLPPRALSASPPPRQIKRSLVAWVVGMAMLLVLGFGWRKFVASEPGTAPNELKRTAIAVLPFENMTHEAAWAGLSTSAPEAIRAELRALPGLRIVDMAPSERQKAQGEGISFFVRGSVQHVGTGLRLLAEVQALDEGDNAGLAEPVAIDVEPSKITEALDTLRRRLLDEVRLSTRYHDKRRRAIEGTKNEAARAKLLQYHAMVGLRPKPEHYEVGLRLLDEAIGADSSYVAALVERAYLRTMGAGGGSTAQRMPQVFADLEKAHEFRPQDPEVVEAFCLLRQYALEATRNLTDEAIDGAMNSCQSALAVVPTSARVHVALARLHDRMCRGDDAMRELERASELDRSLSGRALKHLVGLALHNDRTLLAERMSERLVRFWEEERNLGAHAVSRRAGAPEVRGVFLIRGAVLLRLGRNEEAKQAFERELSELTTTRGDAWAEAAAIRGLLRIAGAQGGSVAPELERRLAKIEADTLARRQNEPQAVKDLAAAYVLVDPVAAVQWVEPAGAPQSCEEAFHRARIHYAATKVDIAAKMLGACKPIERWEKSCISHLTARLPP